MLKLYGIEFSSRLLLGTAGYASPDLLRQAVEASGAEIVTVSLRRESARAKTGQPVRQRFASFDLLLSIHPRSPYRSLRYRTDVKLVAAFLH